MIARQTLRSLSTIQNRRGLKTSNIKTQAVVEHGSQHSSSPHMIEQALSHSGGPESGSLVSTSKPQELQQIPYWQKVSTWKDVVESDFLTYSWQVRNTIQKKDRLLSFLQRELPENIPPPPHADSKLSVIQTRDDFLQDVDRGIEEATMAVKLTPHILSVIDWQDPLNDPVRKQFIPMQSQKLPDHPSLKLDSLHEKEDQAVEGLVHRYPSKVLFLATTICPVYCRFCTRSYAVGQETASTTKYTLRNSTKRIEALLAHINKTQEIQDVVISGGDSYLLPPEQLRHIGESLLAMPHVRRFRFATKGLAVCPSRILDDRDPWTSAFIALSDQGRALGKEVAMHTHFNHPHEISWITRLAARKLFSHGVTVRNQTVLLRDVNDNLDTMSTLIRTLADLNIKPYYVYQADMVAGTEDLRTPLSTILDLQKRMQGLIGGHMLPNFIVDLPGGGGKRDAHAYESYDPESGVSVWTAPSVAPGETFEYHDPVPRV